MASPEERARTMAEYLAGVEREEDASEDFEASSNIDDDDGDSEYASEESSEQGSDPPPAKRPKTYHPSRQKQAVLNDPSSDEEEHTESNQEQDEEEFRRKCTQFQILFNWQRDMAIRNRRYTSYREMMLEDLMEVRKVWTSQYPTNPELEDSWKLRFESFAFDNAYPSTVTSKG